MHVIPHKAKVHVHRGGIFQRAVGTLKGLFNHGYLFALTTHAQVQARGSPREDDPTIAGHLLRLRDAQGRPLSQERLHAEFSVMFIGGAPYLSPDYLPHSSHWFAHVCENFGSVPLTCCLYYSQQSAWT